MTQHHRATFDPKEMPDMPHMDTIHVQRNPHVPKPKMTPEREYILCEQAFGLRARGKTYRQMAALLGISVSAAYARAQTFMIAENEHHEHFPSDTRAECESLLRQTVGPVVADAQLGNLASFRALVSYSNTMIKWAKVPNPSRRKLCRRIERLKKYMDEQDPDLSPTRQKQVEMAEQAARESREQTGEHAENARRTSGEQNQQPVAEQQVAAENTKSAPSSSKRPGNGGGSAGINVVLMLILLTTVGLACRAWAGYPSQRNVQNQGEGAATHIPLPSDHPVQQERTKYLVGRDLFLMLTHCLCPPDTQAPPGRRSLLGARDLQPTAPTLPPHPPADRRKISPKTRGGVPSLNMYNSPLARAFRRSEGAVVAGNGPMICVSIGRSRERHVVAEHKHLAEQGARLVELRLDYINGDIPVKKLLADRPTPVVIACRRRNDGGKFSGSEDARQQILRSAIAEGVDYIDLEEDVAATIRRYGKTKRIVSHHDFRQTPADLEDIHARLAGLDADIVKIAVMANSPHDNLRVLKMVQQAKVPTIGLCMGEFGTPSRILTARFGSPFTYATFHQERTLAPGQLSFDQMKSVYHYDQIDSETAVYAVIADPIGHSLSPLVHNAAMRHMGINAVYVPFRVPKQDLGQFLKDAPQLGIRGLSVTIPHKEAVIPHLARVDRAVREIGAANTLVWEEGHLIGYNTDSRAALDSLEPHLPKPDAENPGKQSKALVLGAGGAAMAVAYGLKRRGYDVFVAGRTKQRADALAARLGCEAVGWNARHSVDCDVLVNCTPLGMHPNLDETPFPKHHLKPSMVVFDTVYNPENTLLIKDARSQGCAVATGVEMFIRQASLQFKLFTGENAPAELMRDTLKKAISAAKH